MSFNVVVVVVVEINKEPKAVEVTFRTCALPKKICLQLRASAFDKKIEIYASSERYWQFSHSWTDA